MFYISAAFYIIDDVFYVIFGSGTEQSWNRITDDDSDSIANESLKIINNSQLDRGYNETETNAEKDLDARKRQTTSSNADLDYNDYAVSNDSTGEYINKAYK